MQNQKYWPHIPRSHTGIYLFQQSTPLNQSDKTAINQKNKITHKTPPHNNNNTKPDIDFVDQINWSWEGSLILSNAILRLLVKYHSITLQWARLVKLLKKNRCKINVYYNYALSFLFLFICNKVQKVKVIKLTMKLPFVSFFKAE